LDFRNEPNTNGVPVWKMRDQQLSSYAMNGAVCGYKSTNDSNRPRRLAQYAGGAYYLWEQDESFRQVFHFNDGANSPTEGISLRHVIGALVGMFDGHAEWFSKTKWDTETNKQPGLAWCSPDTATGR
jgi:hypothetical protein